MFIVRRAFSEKPNIINSMLFLEAFKLPILKRYLPQLNLIQDHLRHEPLFYHRLSKHRKQSIRNFMEEGAEILMGSGGGGREDALYAAVLSSYIYYYQNPFKKFIHSFFGFQNLNKDRENPIAIFANTSASKNEYLFLISPPLSSELNEAHATWKEKPESNSNRVPIKPVAFVDENGFFLYNAELMSQWITTIYEHIVLAEESVRDYAVSLNINCLPSNNVEENLQLIGNKLKELIKNNEKDTFNLILEKRIKENIDVYFLSKDICDSIRQNFLINSQITEYLAKETMEGIKKHCNKRYFYNIN